MGKTILAISMSLDGFIAGPGDDVQHLFKWYFSGDIEVPVQKGNLMLKVSRQSADLMHEAFSGNGAMVAGRRMFDVAHGWGGTPPFAPCFIVTHNPPKEWAEKPDSPFVFVTDGVESAFRQARQAAGDKNVAVATASVAQQALKLGLLDEIHIDLAPVLLGEGTPLFKHLGIEPIELECTRVIVDEGVTHLTYRVIK